MRYILLPFAWTGGLNYCIHLWGYILFYAGPRAGIDILRYFYMNGCRAWSRRCAGVHNCIIAMFQACRMSYWQLLFYLLYLVFWIRDFLIVFGTFPLFMTQDGRCCQIHMVMNSFPTEDDITKSLFKWKCLRLSLVQFFYSNTSGIQRWCLSFINKFNLIIFIPKWFHSQCRFDVLFMYLHLG